MRTQERGKQAVTLRPGIGATDGIMQWGPGVEIRAALQPAGGAIMAAQYGERLQKMKLMIYDGSEPINEGAGVCVGVPGTAPCDYRVVSAEGWTGHQRATLELIPEARRQ